MATDDLYKRLQVDPQADSVVIRAAYHALARKYHPDAGGDLHRMVEVNEAWAVLGNPMLRSAYDTERQSPKLIRAATERPGQPGGYARGPADRPPQAARDSTSALDFGRYAGWSLTQVLERDPDYLEWVVRTSIGRRLSAEIRALLEARELSRAAAGAGLLARTSVGRSWLGRASRGRR